MADLTLTAAQIAPVFVHSALDESYDIVCAVAITAGQAIRQNTSGKASLADANAGSGAEKAIGLALKTKGAGQGVTYLRRGIVYGFDLSGLAYGALVYLSDTAGALADAPSTTNSVPVGRVMPLSESDATKVLFVDFPVVMPSVANFVFVSAEQTGTGAAQNVAHGLGVVPSKVFIAPTELAADLTAGYDVAEGSHTSTNVVLTVTSGAKFKVMAFA